jgi:hypothetical protein
VEEERHKVIFLSLLCTHQVAFINPEWCATDSVQREYLIITKMAPKMNLE